MIILNNPAPSPEKFFLRKETTTIELERIFSSKEIISLLEVSSGLFKIK